MHESGHILPTEQRNPASDELDLMSTLEIVRLINRQDAQVPLAISEVLPQIAQAVDIIAEQLARGRRLFYMGAGTSGRLAVLDASELQPTFSLDPGRVIALLAGGSTALTESIEAAEDDRSQGATDLAAYDFASGDVLVGLAASGRTPYVLGGLEYARKVGGVTIAVACNLASPISKLADIAIEVLTGPEVVTGSTRLKAGTAQKLVLNMLSTAAMVKLGKVYGNLMVDVQPTNHKLRERAVRIVSDAAVVPPHVARNLLEEPEWNVKVAVAMGLLNEEAQVAKTRLFESGGHLRVAIRQARGPDAG